MVALAVVKITELSKMVSLKFLIGRLNSNLIKLIILYFLLSSHVKSWVGCMVHSSNPIQNDESYSKKGYEDVRHLCCALQFPYVPLFLFLTIESG